MGLLPFHSLGTEAQRGEGTTCGLLAEPSSTMTREASPIWSPPLPLLPEPHPSPLPEGCHPQGGPPLSARCAPPAWSPGRAEPDLGRPRLPPKRGSWVTRSRAGGWEERKKRGLIWPWLIYQTTRKALGYPHHSADKKQWPREHREHDKPPRWSVPDSNPARDGMKLDTDKASVLRGGQEKGGRGSIRLVLKGKQKGVRRK